MKATQFRMGNIIDIIDRNNKIHLPANQPMKIGEIGFFNVSLYEIEKPFSQQKHHFKEHISNLCGVFLTEKWLVKFGFENKGKFSNKLSLIGENSGDMDGSIIFTLNDYEATIYLLEGVFYYEIDSHTDNYGEHITTKKNEYVHTLQNVYYYDNLKFKELEIKTK